MAYALAQRGKPYRWGARGPDAFDCSGLTWAAWRAAGVAIPRTAAGQLAGLPQLPSSQPVARPASLSVVNECVSNTIADVSMSASTGARAAASR